MKIIYFLSITFLFLTISKGLKAQPNNFAKIRNLKLIEEHTDGRGNLLRTVQFTEGNMTVTQTIYLTGASTSSKEIEKINSKKWVDTVVKKTINKEEDSLYLVIDKSDHQLKVCFGKQVLRIYHSVFGPQPMMDKMMEGDRNTPEGTFKIAKKNPNSKYHRFLGLNYPTEASYTHFKQLKEQGLIPKNANIGKDIGIHGIWDGGDDMIEMGVGWTDGCIALKNKDIEELYNFIKEGTTVLIRK